MQRMVAGEFLAPERKVPMKRCFVDILFGLLVIVLVLAVQFVVTLPFTEAADSANPERWQQLINRELLLASLPMLIITYLLAKGRRTLGIADGAARGGIWALGVLLFYLFIGNQNGSLELIFGSVGLYLLAACILAGPLLQGFAASRKKSA